MVELTSDRGSPSCPILLSPTRFRGGSGGDDEPNHPRMHRSGSGATIAIPAPALTSMRAPSLKSGPLRGRDYFDCPELDHDMKKYLVKLANETANHLIRDTLEPDQASIVWKPMSTIKGIEILRGFPRESSADSKETTCLRGVAELSASIEEFAMLFKLDTNRKLAEHGLLFNPDLLDMTTLYSLVQPSGDHPRRYVGIKWCLVQSPSRLFRNRDFCYLECQKEFRNANGRRGWVRSMHSIKLPCCPSLEKAHGIVRASIYRCGLIAVETDKPGVLDTTYTIEMDLKGHFPEIFQPAFMSQRIAALASIDKYLQQQRLSSSALLGDLDLPAQHKLKGTCQFCFRAFSTFTRRHICRKCGEGVCRYCSDEWALDIPAVGKRKVRICTVCSAEARSCHAVTALAAEYPDKVGAADTVTGYDHAAAMRAFRREQDEQLPTMHELPGSQRSTASSHLVLDDTESTPRQVPTTTTTTTNVLPDETDSDYGITTQRPRRLEPVRLDDHLTRMSTATSWARGAGGSGIYGGSDFSSSLRRPGGGSADGTATWTPSRSGGPPPFNYGVHPHPHQPPFAYESASTRGHRELPYDSYHPPHHYDPPPPLSYPYEISSTRGYHDPPPQYHHPPPHQYDPYYHDRYRSSHQFTGPASFTSSHRGFMTSNEFNMTRRPSQERMFSSERHRTPIFHEWDEQPGHARGSHHRAPVHSHSSQDGRPIQQRRSNSFDAAHHHQQYFYGQEMRKQQQAREPRHLQPPPSVTRDIAREFVNQNEQQQASPRSWHAVRHKPLPQPRGFTYLPPPVSTIAPPPQRPTNQPEPPLSPVQSTGDDEYVETESGEWVASGRYSRPEAILATPLDIKACQDCGAKQYVTNGIVESTCACDGSGPDNNATERRPSPQLTGNQDTVSSPTRSTNSSIHNDGTEPQDVGTIHSTTDVIELKGTLIASPTPEDPHRSSVGSTVQVAVTVDQVLQLADRLSQQTLVSEQPSTTNEKESFVPRAWQL